MTVPDLTADLPAPRDDEPESLRADIVDELSDHLKCAIRREELRSNSEPWGSAPRDEVNDGGAEHRRSPADHRALARFGNPAAIARKLWWDHMQEKIMAQRISLVLQGCMAAAFVAMCALLWQANHEQARFRRELFTQLHQASFELQRSQKLENGELLTQLEERASGAAATATLWEWNPLTVKCTFDEDDGPPAAGVKVRLQGGSENTSGIPTINVTTGIDGIADFGRVLYGEYRLLLVAPNGMQRTESVTVLPGRPQHAMIVCPSGEGLTAITPSMEPNPRDPPPAELADQLWYLVELVREPTDAHWSRPATSESLTWVIGPQGQTCDVTPLLPLPARQFNDTGNDGTLPRSAVPPGPLSHFISHDVLLPPDVGTAPLIAEPGGYAVHAVTACLISPDTSEGTRLLCLAPPVHIRDNMRMARDPRAEPMTPTERARIAPAFTVVDGQPAKVKIPLVDERFDYIRRVLDAAPDYIPLRLSAKTTGAAITSVMWRDMHSDERAELGAQSLPRDVKLLSGIEVLAIEHAERPRARLPGTRVQPGELSHPRFGITAILLVTPEEYTLLDRFQNQLVIAPVSKDTPRTSIDPDVLRIIEESSQPAQERGSARPET